MVRLARLPQCVMRWRHSARSIGAVADFPHILAEHSTPLLRDECPLSPEQQKTQKAKETNVGIAAAKTHLILLAPESEFSYHALVGWPSRLRGFKVGLELKNGKPSKGVGGGCCSLSNLLYLVALQSGLTISERHRHGLDLFPDHNRTIPFGCGATVFYPYADLKFTNPFPFPVLLETFIEAGQLIGRVCCEQDPGYSFALEERDHAFTKVSTEPDTWIRENRIIRQKMAPSGEVIDEIEIVKNKGKCLYDPEKN